MLKKEFVQEAFKGYKVPVGLKNTVINICSKFNINGVCDPIYICNVIAYELGCGDGEGNFNHNRKDASKIIEVAHRLTMSYGCNIDNELELVNIIKRGLL